MLYDEKNRRHRHERPNTILYQAVITPAIPPEEAQKLVDLMVNKLYYDSGSHYTETDSELGARTVINWKRTGIATVPEHKLDRPKAHRPTLEAVPV